MKTFLSLSKFFLIAAILGFSSCQKEYTFQETKVVSTTTSDSTYLSQYIELDTSFTAPFDTVSIKKFIYDNQKRNSLIQLFNYNSSGQPLELWQYQFYYNGTDTLPYKKILQLFNLPGMVQQTYNDTSYYQYSNGA